MKKLKNNVVNFPNNLSETEREVEAILFAATEPLDIDTIYSRISKKTDVLKILEKLQETYSKNNEEVPDDLSRFLKEEKINCEGSAVKEDEPEFEVVKIIRVEKKEEKKEKKDEDDDDFFIVKRPRIK